MTSHAHLEPSLPRNDQTKCLEQNPSSLGFRQRIRQWRNRKIADPDFRRKVERFWLTRSFANTQANELFQITAGFVYSQVLFACVELDLFKLLFGGPISQNQISAHLTAKGNQIEENELSLLLDSARSLKLFIKDENGFWTLDDLGVVVHADEGIRAMIRHHSMLYQDLADPVKLLRTPNTPTQTSRYWAYATAKDPADISDSKITPYSNLMRHSQQMIAEAIIHALPIPKQASLLDIGGGDGTFLAHLHQHNPSLKLKLFDLPAVAERARHRFAENFENADFEANGGDFFKSDLNANTDYVTLVRILCDHKDDSVLALLKNLHRSMGSSTRLIIAEAMDGDGAGERLASAYFNMYFAAMRSGKSRTPAKIGKMLSEAGFSKSKTIKTSNPLIATIIVAEK